MHRTRYLDGRRFSLDTMGRWTGGKRPCVVRDDSQLVQVKGMTVKEIVGSGEDVETHILDDVDSMNDDIQRVKLNV